MKALVALVLASALPLAGQSLTFKVSPATLSFNHQLGDTQIPASQTVTIAGSVGFAMAITGGPWLTATPVSGNAPVTAWVTANPSSLPVGTYSGTITVITAEQAPQQAVVTVTLVVRAPASTLTASTQSVTVNYVRGAPPPVPAQVSLTTSGAVLQFTTAAAGGAWLTATPRSAVVFPAFPGTVSIVANPLGLAPGAYKGTVTVSAPQASSKTLTVAVALNVSPGAPALHSVWPNQITKGAPATAVTLQGENFFPGTVVKVGTAAIQSTYVGTNVMTASLPTAMLAEPSTLVLSVSNPGGGGGDSGTRTVTVVPPGPVIAAVVNTASYASDRIAPGSLVTLFGGGLGPAAVATFRASGGAVPKELSGTRVLFGDAAAPVLYASAGQVSVAAPGAIAGLSTVEVRAEFDGVRSQPVTVPVAAVSPGVFTVNSAGAGPAVVLAFDEASASYGLVTESAAAPRGSVILFYATGDGVAPASDGLLVTQPATSVDSRVSVRIGDVEAPVLYAGGVVGLVSGLIQVNARVPEVAPGKSLPLVFSVGGVASQPGVTIAIK